MAITKEKPATRHPFSHVAAVTQDHAKRFTEAFIRDQRTVCEAWSEPFADSGIMKFPDLELQGEESGTAFTRAQDEIQDLMMAELAPAIEAAFQRAATRVLGLPAAPSGKTAKGLARQTTREIEQRGGILKLTLPKSTTFKLMDHSMFTDLTPEQFAEFTLIEAIESLSVKEDANGRYLFLNAISSIREGAGRRVSKRTALAHPPAQTSRR